MSELYVYDTLNVDKRRQCFVFGKERAFFHRWCESYNPVATVCQETCAIVELENGQVILASPKDIRFADGGDFDKYDWYPAYKFGYIDATNNEPQCNLTKENKDV